MCFIGYNKCGSGCVEANKTVNCDKMNQCALDAFVLKSITNTSPVGTSCSMVGTEFTCADGITCLPKEWILDGQNDCKDGSDEGLRANESL